MWSPFTTGRAGAPCSLTFRNNHVQVSQAKLLAKISANLEIKDARRAGISEQAGKCILMTLIDPHRDQANKNASGSSTVRQMLDLP